MIRTLDWWQSGWPGLALPRNSSLSDLTGLLSFQPRTGVEIRAEQPWEEPGQKSILLYEWRLRKQLREQDQILYVTSCWENSTAQPLPRSCLLTTLGTSWWSNIIIILQLPRFRFRYTFCKGDINKLLHHSCGVMWMNSFIFITRNYKILYSWRNWICWHYQYLKIVR